MGAGINKRVGGKPDPRTHGTLVSRFERGQLVNYESGPGKPIGTGRISKLHMCGTCGMADIKPTSGARKVSRKLQAIALARSEEGVNAS